LRLGALSGIINGILLVKKRGVGDCKGNLSTNISAGFPLFRFREKALYFRCKNISEILASNW
jgi:hypothetical protein